MNRFFESVDRIRRHVNEPLRIGLVLRLPVGLPGSRAGEPGAAVIRVVAGDDLVFSRTSGLGVILSRHLDGELVGFRSATGKFDSGELLRQQRRQQIGKPERGRIGRHGRRGERDLARLLGCDIDDRIDPMSIIDGEDTGQPVDIFLAENIPDPDALTPLENKRIIGKGLHLIEIDHHLRCVELQFGHGAHSRLSQTSRSFAGSFSRSRGTLSPTVPLSGFSPAICSLERAGAPPIDGESGDGESTLLNKCSRRCRSD